MKALGVGIGAFAFHDVEVVVDRRRRAVARAGRGGEGAGRRAWRARLAPVAHPHRAGRRGRGDRRVGGVVPATPSVEPYGPCHRGSPQGYKRCRGWGERPHPTTGRANRGGRSRIPRWRVERVPGLSSRSARPPCRSSGRSLAPSAQRPVPRPPRRAPVRYETGDLHRHARGDAGHRRCGSRTRRGPHRARRSRRGPRRPPDARAAPTGAGSSWWPARATTATTGAPRPRLLQAWGMKVVVLDAADAHRVVPSCDLVIDAAYGTGFRGTWEPPDAGGAAVLAVDIPSGVDGLTGAAEGPVLAGRPHRDVRGAEAGPPVRAGPAAGRRGGGGRHRPAGPVGDAPRRGVRRRRVAAGAAHRHQQVAGRGVGGGGLAGDARRRPPRDASGPAGRCRHGAAVVARRGRTIRCSPPRWSASPVDGRASLPSSSTSSTGSTPSSSGRAWAGPTPRWRAFVGSCADAALPVLLDGDGLFAVHEQLGCVRDRTAPTVLTPHDGEYAVLAGSPPGDDRIGAARRLADDLGAVVLLKGPATVVAAPGGRGAGGVRRRRAAGHGRDGRRALGHHRRRSSPRVWRRSRAAALGAWVHGSAAELGPGRGLVAGDLPDLIPSVLAAL